MKRLRIRLLLIVSLAGAQGWHALAADWKTQKRLAETYAAQGKADDALAVYDSALKEPQAPNERIETHLGKAALLERLGRDAGAAEIYQQALADAPGATNELRLLATNNYGAFLLRKQDAEKAAAVLGPIESEIAASKTPAVAQARYFYNLAQAFERMGAAHEEDAFSRYVRVVKLDATMKSAGTNAAGLALGAADAPSGIAMSLQLLDAQLTQKDFVGAGTLMKEACSRRDWVRSPAYSGLLTGVVKYFTSATLSPVAFADDWQGILTTVQNWSADADKGRAEAVVAVYSAKVPLLLDRHYTPLPFSTWRSASKDDAETFSAFTKMVGDSYAVRATDQKEDTKSLRAALQLYGLAWSIASNVDAALYMANLLLERSSEVDPTGAVLNEFIGRTFSAKGEAYISEDWPDVVRLHTLLGTIFERQKRWGPEYDARSAVFQWRHAIQAQRRLPGKEPPMLHERLATVYEGLPRPGAAWSERVAAAEGYLADQRKGEACQQLRRAAALEYRPTAKDKERAVKLEQNCSGIG